LDSGGGDLQAAAQDWQTPGANDWKGACQEGQRQRQLDEQVEVGSWAKGLYPTPSATPYGSAQNEGRVEHKRPSKGTPSLSTWASSLPAPEATGGRSRSSLRRRLNPAFVCWLMGFPWWWTQAEPISFGAQGTQSFLSRLRLLYGIYSGD
jgi:hypothetical protein